MKIVMTLTALCLTGCIPQADLNASAARMSSKTMNCPAQKIKITKYQAGMAGYVATTWVATGCRRTFKCVHATSGATSRMGTRRSRYKCTETGTSQTDTLEKVAIDRLSLKTGCEAFKIKVVQRGGWTSGGERAYRMQACGSPYLCTAKPGATTCEKAEASPSLPQGRDPR